MTRVHPPLDETEESTRVQCLLPEDDAKIYAPLLPEGGESLIIHRHLPEKDVDGRSHPRHEAGSVERKGCRPHPLVDVVGQVHRLLLFVGWFRRHLWVAVVLRGHSPTIKGGQNVAALQSPRKVLLGEENVLRDLDRPPARLSPHRNLRPRVIQQRSQRHGKQDGRRRLRPPLSRQQLQRRSRGRLGNLLSDPLLKRQPDQKENGRDAQGQPRLVWRVGIGDKWCGSHPPCHPTGKSCGFVPCRRQMVLYSESR